MRLPVCLILLGPLIGKEKWEVGEGGLMGRSLHLGGQPISY
jgi:hypothetical protein